MPDAAAYIDYVLNPLQLYDRTETLIDLSMARPPPTLAYYTADDSKIMRRGQRTTPPATAPTPCGPWTVWQNPG